MEELDKLVAELEEIAASDWFSGYAIRIQEIASKLREALLLQQQQGLFADPTSTIASTEAPSASVVVTQCRHGWRGTAPEDGERIMTPCPACGAQSLFIGKGGHLTCARVPSRGSDGCPSPGVEDTVRKMKGALSAVAREDTEDSEGDWQCRDYADGWITFPDRAAAEHYQHETGAMMRYRRFYPAGGTTGPGTGRAQASDEAESTKTQE